jgi:hypothetical protein
LDDIQTTASITHGEGAFPDPLDTAWSESTRGIFVEASLAKTQTPFPFIMPVNTLSAKIKGAGPLREIQGRHDVCWELVDKREE